MVIIAVCCVKCSPASGDGRWHSSHVRLHSASDSALRVRTLPAAATDDDAASADQTVTVHHHCLVFALSDTIYQFPGPGSR